MEEIEFGPSHPVHGRVTWANDHWADSHPIILPKAFIEHLCRNSITPKDRNLVHNVRKDVLDEIKMEEIEIMKVQERLAYLENRLEGKKKKAFTCDVILSPFRRLPLDILHQISLHCRPDEYIRPKNCSPAFGSSTYHYPSVLASTCQPWRETVHSISSLWQLISVDCTPWTLESMPTLTSNIERFIKLSKSLPLTIHLEETLGQSQSKIYTCLENILDWLVLEMGADDLNRVCKISLRPCAIKSLLGCLGRYHEAGIRLPSVKTLLVRDVTVNSVLDSYQMDLEDFYTISACFPNVCQFWFGQRHSVFNCCGTFTHLSQVVPDHPYPPFTNITSMYMGAIMDFEDFYYVLAVSPNLELALFKVEASSPHSHTLSLVHRQLRELVLSLQVSHHTGATHILNAFIDTHFPSLQLLRLDFCSTMGSVSDHEDDIVHPSRFLRTFPSLRTLVIGNDDAPFTPVSGYYNLLPLVLGTPSVTTISILVNSNNHFMSTVGFFLGGARPHAPSNGISLPNLQFLNIWASFFHGSDDIIELQQGLELLGHAIMNAEVRYKTVGAPRLLDDIDHEHDMMPTDEYRVHVKGLQHQAEKQHTTNIRLERVQHWDRPFDLPLEEWYLKMRF